MKNTLRGLGIGIFLAGAFWTVYDSVFAPSPDEQIALLEQQLQDSEQKVKHLQETEKVNSSKEETPAKATKTTADEADAKEEKPAEEKSAEEPTVAPEPDVESVTGTIYIYENVSLYDIGKQAEDAGIIENGRELELYLYKPEYSRSIQKGQFELSSSMSLEEMAKILTGKQK